MGAIKLEDIEKIRVSRTNLAKWVGHLHCDKTVTGSFVKVSIGTNRSKENQYLMCEVAAIKEQSEYYKIDEISGAETNKILVVRYGKRKREMKFNVISNAEFT